MQYGFSVHGEWRGGAGGASLELPHTGGDYFLRRTWVAGMHDQRLGITSKSQMILDPPRGVPSSVFQGIRKGFISREEDTGATRVRRM